MKSTNTVTARSFIMNQLVHAKVPGVFTTDILIGLHEARFVPAKPHVVMVISEYAGVFYLLEVKMYNDLSMSIEEVSSSTDFFEVLVPYMCA